MLEDVVGPVSRILVLLFAATGFVLLIVCANVSNFLLARGEGRLREMAIRSALGAERRRLVRLAGIESLALALLGGAAGTGIAWLSVVALRAFEGSGVPRAADVAVDGTALAFAAGVTMFAAIAFGLVPALRASSCRPQSALRGDDRTTSASASRQRFRRALVAIEVCAHRGARLRRRSDAAEHAPPARCGSRLRAEGRAPGESAAPGRELP